MLKGNIMNALVINVVSNDGGRLLLNTVTRRSITVQKMAMYNTLRKRYFDTSEKKLFNLTNFKGKYF